MLRVRGPSFLTDECVLVRTLIFVTHVRQVLGAVLELLITFLLSSNIWLCAIGGQGNLHGS